MVKLGWLGQAGFAATGDRTTVVFDPYLSDLCKTVHGLHRAVEAPVRPSELHADLVLVSHWHEDHLDLDSAAEFVESGATFVAPPSCVARLAGMGIASAKLVAITAGQTAEFTGANITAVSAHHRVAGFITEDAVGFVVELDGVRIYHSGDTEYDRALLAANDRGRLDVALLCTNGTGGNMNATEAAMLASQLDAELVVPMHFGMWSPAGYGPGATLDPTEFIDIYRRVSPYSQATVPELGTDILLASD
jgi:L-ascorbate metabolism protein UlaG (beta-lactamase superfamily)